MEKAIILISTQKDEINRIIGFLDKNNYPSLSIGAMGGLDACLLQTAADCVIIDLDSIRIDNRTIRELTLQYPHVYFLCMSSDRFHPKLKDAICYHIYACLTKPVDYDELLYWLKCIDNESDSNLPGKNERPINTDH
ncbi:MAG: hypothetical protein A2097_09145 [Desulfobacula sp. GWF2_41_7]|nr:MAG: hypothetical protein A2097_09145 [Desulfobacula sp. GWF2_41_7]